MTGLALILSASLFFACQQDVPTMEKPSQDQESRTELRDLNELLSVPQRSTKVSLKQALAATQEQGQGELRALQNKRVQSTSTLYTSSGEPALYIINYSPEGYAVVSASRNYTPIVAHSPKGFISLKDDNNPAKALLEDYVRQIEYANTLPDSLTRLARMQWEMLNNEKPEHLRSIEYDEEMYRKVINTISKYKDQGYRVYRYRELLGEFRYPESGENYPNHLNMLPNDNPPYNRTGTRAHELIDPNTKREIDQNILTYASKVYNISDYVLIAIKEHHQEAQHGPLISTSWGQGWQPKNDLENELFNSVPQYNMYIKNRYFVGCVAVAVAQIMRYHRYPNKFNWNAMPNHYPTEATAKFLHKVAIEVDTTFEPEGSSSDINNAKAFLEREGYSAHKIDEDDYFMIPVVNELNLNHPVYIRGNEPGADKGHAFIIDGYDYHSTRYEVKVLALPEAPESYLKHENITEIFSTWLYPEAWYRFHLNLGWNSWQDGYYSFSKFPKFQADRKFLLITPPNNSN